MTDAIGLWRVPDGSGELVYLLRWPAGELGAGEAGEAGELGAGEAGEAGEAGRLGNVWLEALARGAVPLARGLSSGAALGGVADTLDNVSRWLERTGGSVDRVIGGGRGLLDRLKSIVGGRRPVCVADCGTLYQVEQTDAGGVLAVPVNPEDCRGREVLIGSAVPGWRSPCALVSDRTLMIGAGVAAVLVVALLLRPRSR